MIVLLLGGNLFGRQEDDETFAIRQVILRFDGKNQYIMLSPMRIYSPYNGLYFALKLAYTPGITDLVVKEGDLLTFDIDYGRVVLSAYQVRRSAQELVAYYQIDKWDLVDIGHAGNAVATISDQKGSERIDLSRNNLNEYKLFAAGYVLGTLYIPDSGIPAPKRWGFLSIGYGTVFGTWLTKYTELFFAGTDLVAGDFLSAGIGFAPFSYYVYEVTRSPVYHPDIGWYLEYGYRLPEKNSDPVYHFGIMYGVTNRSLFEGFTVELGLSVQYFLHRTGYDDAFIIHQTPLYPGYPEQVYRVLSGSPLQGFAGGVFLQAGVIWLHANSLQAWSAGISAPLPWW